MAQEIKIKRSNTALSPASLKEGELAYGYVTNEGKLSIGRPDTDNGSGATVDIVGGTQFVSDVNNATSLGTNNAIVKRSNTGGFTAGNITSTGFLGHLTGNIKNSNGTVIFTNGSNNTAATFTGNVTGDVKGDIQATDGTVVLNNGTDGTDATFTGAVTGDVSGSSGSCTGNAATATSLASNITINSNTVNGGSTLTLDADDISEASSNPSNLYFTDTRAYTAIKAALNDATHSAVSVGFDDDNETIALTGTASVSAGIGVSVDGSEVSIGQAVGTTSSPAFASTTISSTNPEIVLFDTAGSDAFEFTSDNSDNFTFLRRGSYNSESETSTNIFKVTDNGISFFGGALGSASSDLGVAGTVWAQDFTITNNGQFYAPVGDINVGRNSYLSSAAGGHFKAGQNGAGSIELGKTDHATDVDIKSRLHAEADLLVDGDATINGGELIVSSATSGATLTVAGQGSGEIILGDATTTPYIYLTADSGEFQITTTDDSRATPIFDHYSVSTEVGNIGIRGEAAQAYPVTLHGTTRVNGNVTSTGQGTFGGAIGILGTPSDSDNPLSFITGATVKWRLNHRAADNELRIEDGTTPVITIPDSNAENPNITIARDTDFTGDVSVQGTLTVTGSQTTITSTELAVGDTVITLNDDHADSTAADEDAGIEINRGKLTNDVTTARAKAELVFDASELEWVVITPASADTVTQNASTPLLTVANIESKSYVIDGGSFA